MIIINIVMPSIVNSFEGGADKSQWLISGYSMAISVTLLCCSWFARRFGTKLIYLIGIAIFTLGSFLCSIATSIDYLIVMRMLQGVGSGIIIPISMSIIAQSFSERSRGLAIGLLIMSTGMAVSAGPFLGGYFVKIDEWDWIFKMNVPIGILAFLMAIFIIKEHKDGAIAKYDYISTILLLIWVPLSLYILSSDQDWWLVLILATSILLFVLRMIYSKNTLIDSQIFRNRNFVLAFIVMFCYGMMVQGGNYALSEYLLYGLDYSSYKAGLLFIPSGIILAIISPLTGAMTNRYGCRLFIFIGLSITLVYLYLSSSLNSETPHWYILLTLYIRSFGIGMTFTALTNLSFDGIKTDNIASASGAINMSKQLSGSFSVMIIALLLAHDNSTASIADKYIQNTDTSFTYMIGLIIVCFIAMLSIRKTHKT